MVNHAIHWGEGLYLRPHHFQAVERNLRDENRLSEDWYSGYAYGLHRIEIDHEAMANWQVSLAACHLRLRDGTHVRYPEDANLEPISIPRDAFRNPQDRVMVHLGLPRLKLGRENATRDGNGSTIRYLVDSQEVEDENQPGSPQMLDIKWPKLKLFVGDTDISGYDALPIMRLRLGTTAEAPPEIDTEYIPPLLGCDAWTFLQTNLIGGIYNTIGGLADRLAEQMSDRSVAFESGHREDFERILKLHSLNISSGALANLPFIRGLHPLDAYRELCRVVGTLAIFQPARSMPELPRYDHDDLGKCFWAVWKQLRVDEPAAVPYVKRDFVGNGLQMQVRIEREWLQPESVFYIGVNSELQFHQVERLLMDRLDMKVGAAEDVDQIFIRGRAGLTLKPEPNPSRDLPAQEWTYWRVDRNAYQWEDVEKTLNLGIRMNESQIKGTIDGERQVLIKSDDGKLVGISFALYAMSTVPPR